MCFQAFSKCMLQPNPAGQAQPRGEEPHAVSASAYRRRAAPGASMANPSSNEPPWLKSASNVRFAAVGDIHVTKDSAGSLRAFFAQAAEAADALLLCGDLTDYGTAEEAHVLADELAARQGARSSPCWATTTTSPARRRSCRRSSTHAGVRVLDGEACEIEGVGFAGRQGLRRRLRPRLAGRLGRAGDQAVRAGGAERGDEAGVGAGQAAHAAAHRAAALLAHRRHRGRRAARRSFPSWARAGWRSRCCAIRWTRSSMATRTAARWRARPSTASPSTTWRSRCCSAAGRTSRRSCCSSCRAKRETERRSQRHGGMACRASDAARSSRAPPAPRRCSASC